MTAAIVQIKADPRTAKEIATDLFDELARATGDGVGITRECYAEGARHCTSILPVSSSPSSASAFSRPWSITDF